MGDTCRKFTVECRKWNSILVLYRILLYIITLITSTRHLVQKALYFYVLEGPLHRNEWSISDTFKSCFMRPTLTQHPQPMVLKRWS